MLQEYINSLASDDHTGMDSFHECLQEYGEGLEVVQICLEPEEASIKDEELSALADLSFDDCKKDITIKNDFIDNKRNETKLNGLKSSKSEESIDQDDDLTITEDDVLTPRELKRDDLRSQSADRRKDKDRCLSKQHSKDISTSDEMVFAVTPTGLERISFDKYWKDCNEKIDKSVIEKILSGDNRKECIISPTRDTSCWEATKIITVQEDSNNLLYIDHEIEGYETCLDEDPSLKFTVNGRKINGDREIKEIGKQNKIAFKNKDNDVSAKVNSHTAPIVTDDVPSRLPYLHDHIIKQMRSLKIEPINISNKKKRSPVKSSKNERMQCVEYYNDQAECLKEIRQKKLEEDRNYQDKQRMSHKTFASEKKHLRKQEVSEESTDLESNYVPGCHKCFLENYAYAITKAYMAQANACKYCEVIRDMLEPPKSLHGRRLSAPALVNLESGGSETEDEDLLLVPVVRGRRKSAGPLKFLVPSRRPRYVS